MEKLKLALIGYGGMGSYHLHNILPPEADLFEITGIYDIDAQRQAVALEKELRSYASLEELLGDAAVDVVLIATPNDSHKELAIQAMQAGKHVVCEKPVTMNTQELREILAVAEETQRKFIVHQNRRWDPDFLILKDLLANKQLGEIFQIESRVHGANGIPGDWRHEAKHGGGMLLDWGVHLLDQILWLLDDPIRTEMTDLSFVLGNEVDDGFLTYLTFESGLRVVIEVGTTNFIKLPRWYIKGTKGTAQITDWDLSGEMILAKGNQGELDHPQPIQAGVGLTKTMAPPSEEATEKAALPAGTPMPESFYQNVYEVIVNDAEAIVKNAEVMRVLELMEDILERKN